MARGKAEDAGGLTPAKDGNAAPYHFDPRTLPIFKCVDYIIPCFPPVGKPGRFPGKSQSCETAVPGNRCVFIK